MNTESNEPPTSPAEPSPLELATMLENMGNARFRGSSDNGFVTVIVGVGGRPIDFEFAPRVHDLDTEELRDATLQAFDVALRESRQAAGGMLQATAGDQFALGTGGDTSSSAPMEDLNWYLSAAERIRQRVANNEPDPVEGAFRSLNRDDEPPKT